jgi:hypothetical protein
MKYLQQQQQKRSKSLGDDSFKHFGVPPPF